MRSKRNRSLQDTGKTKVKGEAEGQAVGKEHERNRLLMKTLQNNIKRCKELPNCFV